MHRLHLGIEKTQPKNPRFASLRSVPPALPSLFRLSAAAPNHFGPTRAAFPGGPGALLPEPGARSREQRGFGATFRGSLVLHRKKTKPPRVKMWRLYENHLFLRLCQAKSQRYLNTAKSSTPVTHYCSASATIILLFLLTITTITTTSTGITSIAFSASSTIVLLV